MKTDHKREGETDAEAIARVFLAAGYELPADAWAGVDLNAVRARVAVDTGADSDSDAG